MFNLALLEFNLAFLKFNLAFLKFNLGVLKFNLASISEFVKLRPFIIHLGRSP